MVIMNTKEKYSKERGEEIMFFLVCSEAQIAFSNNNLVKDHLDNDIKSNYKGTDLPDNTIFIKLNSGTLPQLERSIEIRFEEHTICIAYVKQNNVTNLLFFSLIRMIPKQYSDNFFLQNASVNSLNNDYINEINANSSKN